jgi:formamidopyrimidine-DNA glycosylase
VDVLNLSREKGAFAYESDFHGEKGGYTMDYFLVGYKENKPCPACGENIELIKTGSTSSYICPRCQTL